MLLEHVSVHSFEATSLLADDPVSIKLMSCVVSLSPHSLRSMEREKSRKSSAKDIAAKESFIKIPSLIAVSLMPAELPSPMMMGLLLLCAEKRGAIKRDGEGKLAWGKE